MTGPLILCVGKLKEAFFQSACAEYQKRLQTAWPVEIVEIAERIPRESHLAAAEKAMEQEADDLRRLIPVNAFVTALCVEGKAMTSEALAARLQAAEQDGRLVFLIGGSNGLAERIKREASLCLSFSQFTFPHHLARVLLPEQLYRAFTIRTNRKYHK